jgi:hypothetical protein
LGNGSAYNFSINFLGRLAGTALVCVAVVIHRFIPLFHLIQFLNDTLLLTIMAGSNLGADLYLKTTPPFVVISQKKLILLPPGKKMKSEVVSHFTLHTSNFTLNSDEHLGED